MESGIATILGSVSLFNHVHQTLTEDIAMVVEKTDDGREQIRMDGVTIRQSPFQDELFVDSACYLRKPKIKQLILHLQAWVDTGSLELKTGGDGK